MGKKEIYLKAYFRRNLGDDMFVRYAAERYPQVPFRICTSSAFAQPFENLPNIRNMGWVGRFIDKVSNKITGKQICKQQMEKSAGALVHIGGSIFIEPSHFAAPKNYFVHPNTFMIGCNFGPYKTEAYRAFIFSRLEKARDVCFRDRYSFRVFSSLDHVRVAPDVLFGYPNYPALRQGCGVGISVLCLDDRPELKHMADRYYSVIAQTVDTCAQQKIPVKLFSFCEAEGDPKAIREIMRHSKTKCAEVCEYHGDIDSMLEQLNQCEYIVASRFHAMVVGWCLCKKVFPVVYSDKQLHVMHDVGYSGSHWDLRKTEADTDICLMDRILAANCLDVRDYQERAQQQFEMLDGYINEFA